LCKRHLWGRGFGVWGDTIFCKAARHALLDLLLIDNQQVMKIVGNRIQDTSFACLFVFRKKRVWRFQKILFSGCVQQDTRLTGGDRLVLGKPLHAHDRRTATLPKKQSSGIVKSVRLKQDSRMTCPLGRRHEYGFA